ncbi:MAG: hypothetical protein OXF74_06735 [Rhodobacteraceae bacterium]|nr:hypothetical protein [Paracoccaceae bacterium]
MPAPADGMFTRSVEHRLERRFRISPRFSMLTPGAGNTTSVKRIKEADRSYSTLDDQPALDAVRYDPTGFIRGSDRVVIDEV